jgi:hypothetical protein
MMRDIAKGCVRGYGKRWAQVERSRPFPTAAKWDCSLTTLREWDKSSVREDVCGVTGREWRSRNGQDRSLRRRKGIVRSPGMTLRKWDKSSACEGVCGGYGKRMAQVERSRPFPTAAYGKCGMRSESQDRRDRAPVWFDFIYFSLLYFVYFCRQLTPGYRQLPPGYRQLPPD